MINTLPDTPNEEWKKSNLKNWIYVSNLGRIWSMKGKGKFLKPRGYEETYIQIMVRYFPYEWIKHLDDGEEAKPLKNFPNYFITTKGRIWSNVWWMFLKPSLVKNTTCDYYWNVKIDGTTQRVSTLVGKNFLPWKEGLYVLHKEETLSYPEINYLNNLWIGTPKDNSIDRERKRRGRWNKKKYDTIKKWKKL